MLYKSLINLLHHDIVASTRSVNIIHQQIKKRQFSNKMESKNRPEHLQLTATQKREPNIFSAEISSIKQLSPTIKGFTLQVTSKTETPPTFKAGQWVDFFIPGLEKVGGYSMCSEPKIFETEGKLELAVKYSTWAPAQWLHTIAKTGSKVAFKVGGEFHYPNKVIEEIESQKYDHDILLIAGGVGINPLFSIFLHLNQLAKEKRNLDEINNVRVNLLYSSKTKEELIFCDRIKDIVASNKVSGDSMNRCNSFNATFFTTQNSIPEPDFKNKRIDVDDIKEAIKLFSDETNDTRKENKPLFCYLCGPPNMIKDIARILIDLGIPKKRVIYEMWW